ncbi:LacI family DNA-binding transcriptional regulator [Microlunatus antarcticus]|uniref:LacI family transcriptional regulator n=1 Tax=Microlunatus antarcticus TaxID=53388 RepID=A0A7W5P6T7_9ACTN|nr:LacI family transcriptional regulator [Microlunatus antarcticus]
MVVTRSDVAREAGVSPAVVSYVLNNGPRPASAQARARVLDAVQKLGYRPNAIASALRAGSTRTVGFLTPNRGNPFFGALAEAVEQNLNDQGYLMLAANTHGYQPDELKLLRTFVDRRVDGLIISGGTTLVGPTLQEVEQPVLVFDDPGSWAGCSSVQPEDHLDAAAAVDHLQNHGHDLIACVVGPPRIGSEARRLAGWRAQQRLRGVYAGDELVAFADQSEAGGDQAARLLLSDHGRPATLHGRRPTALFVASDVQAIGVLWACHELGVRVPEDVAVVSMGGTRAAAYSIPTLTTVRQDVVYLATTGCTQLLRLVADPLTPQTHLRVRGNLVVGQTCGCTVAGSG